MSNKPTHRIRFTDKATKKKYDCGVIWPARNPMQGLLGSLAPQKTDEDGQYPKMRMSEAVARWERGEGFLDVWSTERSDAQQRQTAPVRDEFDDSDGVPF